MNTRSSVGGKKITKENPYKICFICLGNICRSPTAEGVFRHLIKERGLQDYFEVDSAGTSAYHVGESANSKSRRTAEKHGVTLDSRARQFRTSDLDYYDLVLAMDRENLRNVKAEASGNHEEKIGMLRDFDPQPGDGEVPDPYYGGREGFENVFTIVKRSCERLLSELEQYIQK